MKTELLKVKEDTVITVTADTRFVLDFEEFTSEERYSVDLRFEKEGVEAELIALYTLGNGEKLDLTTVSSHMVPHTSCVARVKGVLSEGSESIYVGKIIIDKNAQQTSSFLEDNVLVTGENVVNKSSPNLQIDANDVKASHGATTGRISENEIFYLMSRGLSHTEAQDIIIRGFFEEIISKIENEEVKKKIYERLSYSK